MFTGKDEDEKQTSIGRAFAVVRLEALLRHARRRHFHFFAEQGLVLPGQFIPGADSRPRVAHTVPSAWAWVRRRWVSAGRRYVWLTLAVAARGLRRAAQPVGRRQGHRARPAPAVSKQSQGMSVEVRRSRDKRLQVVSRNTIANMMAEAEAQNGIFAADEVTTRWYAEKGITALPYPPIAPGPNAIRNRRGVRPVVRRR